MLRIESLCKSWDGVSILDGLSLEVDSGHHTLIMGPSGSGKSTLLHLVARLASPDSGNIYLKDEPIERLGAPARYRLDSIGLVFQETLLLESLSARDNIEMIQAHSPREAIPVLELLEPLGLAGLCDRPVRVLSRGERQRVALARAFANRPALILADEPTASLDPDRRDQCLDHLFSLAERCHSTVVLVSHDPEVGRRVELGQAYAVRNRGLELLPSISFPMEPQT